MTCFCGQNGYWRDEKRRGRPAREVKIVKVEDERKLMVLLAIRNVSHFPSPAIDVARHSWYSTGRFGSPLLSLRRLCFFESKQKQSSLSLVKGGNLLPINPQGLCYEKLADCVVIARLADSYLYLSTPTTYHLSEGFVTGN
jgi:hypothetical protein